MIPLLARISIEPDLCNGRPTIRGRRITVETILELLAAGESREEILRQYPSLEPEDIGACVAFAAASPKRSVLCALRGSR